MADNRYDRLRAASTCGMIGACVSKLRVVSWITIDWQNSRPHRIRTGNRSAAVRSGETHVSGRHSARSQGPPWILYTANACRLPSTRVCIYIYIYRKGRDRHAFAFHASVHVAPGRPVYIDTDVSIRSSWSPPSPEGGGGPVWFPRAAPECPLRESFLNPMISLALPRSPVISDRVSTLVCGASTMREKREGKINKHREEDVSDIRRVGVSEMKRKSRAKIVINIAERVA